jgi:hypothetical protein
MMAEGTFGWHISPEKFLELKNDKGFRKLACPDEDAVASGKPVYWWEHAEVVAHSVADDAKAQAAPGAEYPVTERQIVTCKFQIGAETSWFDANGEDLGVSGNAGAVHVEWMRVQPLGGLPQHDTMTEMSTKKMASIVSAAGGIDEDNIAEIPVDGDGNVDLSGIFDEGAEFITGGGLAMLMKKEKDDGAPGGLNVEIVRCEPLD